MGEREVVRYAKRDPTSERLDSKTDVGVWITKENAYERRSEAQPGRARAPVSGTYDVVTVFGQRLGCRYKTVAGKPLPGYSSTAGHNLPIRYVLRDER